MGKYLGNVSFLSETNSLEFIPQVDSSITTINTLFMSTTTPNTLKYTDSVGTLHTIEIPTNVVDSLNGLTGALSITTPNSTLTITNSSPNIGLDINLAHANTWTALQTFSSGLTVSAGTITLDVVPQTSQGGYQTNTGYGTGALNSNSGSNGNDAFGLNTMYSNTTGNSNSAFGVASLYYNTTGSSNSAFGFEALNSNTTGNDNTAIGYQSMYSNTIGYANSSFGFKSLYTNTEGSGIVAFGEYALEQYNNTANVLVYNTCVGANAGYNYTGTETNNTVLGAVFGVSGESNVIRIGNFNGTLLYGVETNTLATDYLLVNGNIQTPYSNNLIMNPIASTSTTTTENSGYIDLLGSSWNGTASIPSGMRLYTLVSATSTDIYFALNNNGTLTDIFHYNSQYNAINLLALSIGANYINVSGKGNFSSILTDSNGTAPTSLTVGASPFTYTNSTSTNILMYIGGGVVTAIAINGVTVVSDVTLTTLIPLYLKYNDYVTITYTTAPTIYVMNA